MPSSSLWPNPLFFFSLFSWHYYTFVRGDRKVHQIHKRRSILQYATRLEPPGGLSDFRSRVLGCSLQTSVSVYRLSSISISYFPLFRNSLVSMPLPSSIFHLPSSFPTIEQPLMNGDKLVPNDKTLCSYDMILFAFIIHRGIS